MLLCVKETRHERPRNVRFYLYEVSRVSECVETERRLVLGRGEEDVGVEGTVLMAVGFCTGAS